MAVPPGVVTVMSAVPSGADPATVVVTLREVGLTYRTAAAVIPGAENDTDELVAKPVPVRVQGHLGLLADRGR